MNPLGRDATGVRPAADVSPAPALSDTEDSMTQPNDADAATESLDALVDRLSLEQKVRLLTGASFWGLHAEPAIGLETIVVSDGPAGVRGEAIDGSDKSASLPSPTSMAATWDLDRIYRLGELLAAEARRKGIGVVLGPTVNIQRSPRGGRHFENFSEDPWLSGVLGTSYVTGLQDRGVGAAVKHFVANDTETDRMSVDVSVDERTLREVYLAPFERIVREGGSWLVMSAYNAVNGVTMSGNDLLTTPLKDEWGFDGVVISDWSGVRDTVLTGNAGQDLAMPGPDGVWGDALLEAVRAGRVSEAAIDDKVRRILRLAGRLGALDGISAAGVPGAEWTTAAVSDFLRETAADGMVLARNDGILPLTVDSSTTVAVLGQHALRGRHQGGGSANVTPERSVSPLEGLVSAFGEDSIRFAPGVPSADPLVPLDAAVSTDPISGEPGVRVQLVGHDGEVLRDEHRDGGKLGWAGDETLARAAKIRVLARFTARRDGTFPLGFIGFGEFSFRIGDDVLHDGPLYPENMDPAVMFLTPPHLAFPTELVAGQSVDIVLEHVPGPLMGGMSLVIFTVGYQEPFGTASGEFDAAVDVARDADVAVVVVGTTEHIESEGGDRADLRLPDGHDDLVEAVIAVNPRTVVVVNSGAPVLMPWFDRAAAVVLTWFPGQEFGDALADVVAGVVEPGGRVPNTWPAAEADVPVWEVEPVEGRLHYTEGVHVGYREWERRVRHGGPAPLLPFGFGLGYTTWELSDLRLDEAEGAGAALVTVRNTGRRAGKQVVQVYLSRASESTVDRPELWLAGFATVHLEAGESIEARIAIEERSLQYWSTESRSWVSEPGEYAVRAGTSARDLPLSTTLVIR